MYRINKLLKQDQQVFHTNDLALLWGIANQNTLYTTIKRYAHKGILIPLHKGFYATVQADRIEPARLAVGFLHRYAYVSCESVLIEAGVIFQKGNYFTLVSDASKKFSVGGHGFLVRRMKDKYLYNGVGIIPNGRGIFYASVARAVADMLYFNPHYHIDNRKAVDWRRVHAIQKEVGY